MSRESGAGPERNGNGGGMSGNSSKGSSGSSGSSKGGGKNDSGGSSKSSKGSSKSSSSSSKNSNSSGGFSSLGGASSYGMSQGSFNSSIGANNKGQQATSNGKNDSGTVSQRVKSVSSVAQAIASRPTNSAPAYAQPGYGDTINAQRQQLAGPTSSGASSAGSAASYGMTADQFNKTIGTDNFNGTINNLEGKLARGTASETDKASIGQAARDYNDMRGAGILGRIAGGSLGKSAAQTIAGYAMDAPSDYLSGQARLAATGDLDTSRLTGQRGEVGDGSWKDSALNGVMSILGLAAPGAGMLASAAGAAVTEGAPGFGGLLNNMASQTGYSQTGDSKGGGSSGDVRNTTATSQTSQTATPGQAESTLDESYRYDPTKYQFNKGARAATAWSYN